MSLNFYISDLHLFHKNVTKEGSGFDGRPYKSLEEMHRDILNRWNSKITNGDDVYILGDMCWKLTEESIAFVSILKGKKHLILGNHDKVKDLRYRNLFEEICDYKMIVDPDKGRNTKIVMSHYPIAFWNFQHGTRGNGSINKNKAVLLYGHVHMTSEWGIFESFIDSLNENGMGCEAYNVGCMLPYMGYMPQTLQEIRDGYLKYKEENKGKIKYTKTLQEVGE